MGVVRVVVLGLLRELVVVLATLIVRVSVIPVAVGVEGEFRIGNIVGVVESAFRVLAVSLGLDVVFGRTYEAVRDFGFV